MNWVAMGAIAEIAGAAGSIAIACVAVYIGIRQWVDGKRISREQRELTEQIESNHNISTLEQERIIRAQSLDSYFDGISTLLLRDEDGIFTDTARSLTKGRTDAILKILKADEKRNLVAFLYGSGLISRNGTDTVPMVSLSGSDLSLVELNGASLQQAGFGLANLRGAVIKEADLDGIDLRGADLSDADLTGSDLTQADLHGVIAFATVLSGVDLSHADLSGADLRGADLSGSDLTSANLSGVNLHGADLKNAKLENANLSGANLRDANFTGAALQGAQLTNLISIEGADFTGVSALSGESAEYLASIASGAHPETFRQTAQTLKNLSSTGTAQDRA
ncbi:MAG: pentapeptide repeat-containing protein [Chloroflexi bacterium]|nr:pentapeptide repeat-containing protein [Chloroflexota bacterium]